MEHNKKKGHKKSSLWSQIGMVILVCWIVPVLVVLAVTGWNINNRLGKQLTQAVLDTVETEVDTLKTRLESAIVASRNASYYSTPKEALYEYEKTGDGVRLYDQINFFLTQQYKYDEKFLTTLLFYTSEPDQVYYTYNDWYSATYPGVKSYMQQVHKMVKQLSPTLDTEIYFLELNDRLYMVRNLLDSNRQFEPYAVLIMEMNKKALFDGLRTVMWSAGAAVWLDETRVLIGGQDSLYLQYPPKVGLGKGMLKEQSDIALIEGSCGFDRQIMRYTITIDRLELLRELKSVQRAFALLLLYIVPLLALAILFFYRTISRPIVGMITATGRIEEGELGYQIEGQAHSRELQYLTDALNSMSAQLKSQFEMIYSEELALRDARIMALQSQINPHFLNNTLEIINWEARFANNEKVSCMIGALSTMLDAAMDREGRRMVSLAEEMKYVDAYLYIIGIRFGERLKIEKEIDEQLFDFCVPRLILQPIIENAVEHGGQIRGQVIITIGVRKEGETLLLEIKNNGNLTVKQKQKIDGLLSVENTQVLKDMASLGIHNVNQRLRILYGEMSGLHIYDDEKGHVVAQIKIHIPEDGQ